MEGDGSKEDLKRPKEMEGDGSSTTFTVRDAIARYIYEGIRWSPSLTYRDQIITIIYLDCGSGLLIRITDPDYGS